MASSPMPAAEVAIDEGIVRALLAEQVPELAHLPVRPLRTPVKGWDNALYRVGDKLLARLPRRQLAADLVAKEHQWLPELAPRLPLPIPVPLYRGRPSASYPWLWTVCPWSPGEAAFVARERVTDWRALATALGGFLAALHQEAPPGAPLNPWRSGPLAARDLVTRQRAAAMADVVDVAGVNAAWETALGVPEWEGPDVWAHGDLHGGNILVHQGRLSAVVDFGDLTAGDPAVDLLCAWTLLPASERPIFQRAAAVDDVTWARGRGWAVSLALATLAHSADNPVLAQMGIRAIEEVLADSRGVDEAR
jgi:aminoglycoside phosphotransferase (APT) family kinase protein